MFSLRVGIGGRNRVWIGLRNDLFCIATKKLVSGARMCAHGNGPRGHGERGGAFPRPGPRAGPL